ncbi:phage minor capsid protein [Streptomyces misionensis]|uniref:phage minor capsid protein n=1 Tax=Streptomyces misionensis TaxID=67331 RepID=UPI0036CD95CA
MVEDLAARTRDLYAAAEARLLDTIARQLADGLDAPGWVERKLATVQAVRRASQAVVDELGKESAPRRVRRRRRGVQHRTPRRRRRVGRPVRRCPAPGRRHDP